MSNNIGFELDRVLKEIADLNAQHRAATGLEALHIGRCGRVDLHERLAGLHRQAEQLFRAEAREYLTAPPGAANA